MLFALARKNQIISISRPTSEFWCRRSPEALPTPNGSPAISPGSSTTFPACSCAYPNSVSGGHSARFRVAEASPDGWVPRCGVNTLARIIHEGTVNNAG